VQGRVFHQLVPLKLRELWCNVASSYFCRVSVF
jgi:hypothetical protein